MMKRILLILLISVIALGFAAECSPGFSEIINVQVLDGKLRPVQNAKVNYTFQLSKTTGKPYVTTTNFITDQEGKTSYLVTNQEIDVNKLDCRIWIKASYGSATAEKVIIAENHENVVQIKLDLYGVTIFVVDQNNHPLAGAEVWIGNESATTDSQGRAFFRVKSGTSNVYVKYGDGKVEDTVNVENDTIKKIGVGLYPLNLFVRDENGDNLDAIATVANKTYNVTNGVLSLERIATARPIVVIRHKNLEKEVDVDLSLKNDYQVFFDLTAPVIEVADPEFGEQITKLNIKAEDPGSFSSGIAQGGVILEYDINKSKIWTKATVYQKQKGGFVAEIPVQGENSRIDFRITVKDKEGNSASLEGWFIEQGWQPPANETNQTNQTNQTGNNNGGWELGQLGGFPWLAVIGIFIIIVVIVLYFKYKGGGSAEG